MPKQINSFSGKNEKGFTLVEILVSLMLLLILVVAFVPLFTFVSQAIASNKARDVAVEIATQKMEEMRTLPYIVMTDSLAIDTSKDQLGLIGGDPPGSVKPTETVKVNNITYTVNTDIAWGDGEKSFKIVTVSVEAPGIFNKEVKISNQFDTVAAQEGLSIKRGSILVEIYDSGGNLLTDDSIQVYVQTLDYESDTEYTSGGQALFTNLPNGIYDVYAQVPTNMICHPDLIPQFDESTRLLSENNVTVTYNKEAKVIFVIDRSASINFSIRDGSNQIITTIDNFDTSEFALNWQESDTAHSLNYTTRNVTKAEINSGQLNTPITGLWPGGKYIASFQINKNISNNDFRLYNRYYNDNIELTAGVTTNMTINLESPPIKVALLGKRAWVEPLRYSSAKYYVSTWADQSGNQYNATNSTASTQPRFKRDASNKNQLMFEDGLMFLTLPSSESVNAECINNFTIFVSAEADKNHKLDPESETSNTNGTTVASGDPHRYLLYPNHKGADAGMGISLGKNGVTVYEHGADYMPAKAHYNTSLNGYNVIAVKYFKDAAGSANPIPSIYINGELKKTGKASNRSTVYSPVRIGGDTYGYYSGNLRAVLIYDSPTLDDFNIKAVTNFLNNNYTKP